MSEVLSQPIDEYLNKLKDLVPTSGEIEVLQFDDNTAVVLLQDINGMPWLLIEDSFYEPDPRPLYGIDEDEEYPFITTGNQWFVDLEKAYLSSGEFRGEEGDIQGFVYALFAITHGGKLPPDDYKDYFRREIQRALENHDFRVIEINDIEKIKKLIENP